MMMSASKHPILASIFSLLIFLSLRPLYTISCPEIENQSLLTFKQSLQDPSNLLSSWDAKVNCCSWKGVVCSNIIGHVVELHLRGDLSGELNPSLLNLIHLKYLDLSQNTFGENLPSFIGSFTRLEHLNLSSAGFYGKIPHSIGNLSNLHTLSLDNAGPYALNVDNLEWLSGLSKLEYLNMNSVNLSRANNWPQQVIIPLPSLVELHLSGCSLSFTSPVNDVYNISHSNLVTLDLSSNNFDDQSHSIIPSWIFQLSNLIHLDMYYNSFKGPIATVTNATKLQHIDLSINYFSTIPEWLYSYKNLKYVNMGTNNLKDGFSSSIGNLTFLNTLDLSWNNLSGKIPREIATLCNIQTLQLTDNKLVGEINDSFGNMSDCFLGSLEYLYLSGNQLSGHMTRQFGELGRLQTLDLSENSLSGVIPDEIGNLFSLEELWLSHNKLTGNLPESIGRLVNLTRLSIEGNMLEGVVTETHFANLSNFMFLEASGNHLTLKVNPNWIPPFELYTLRLGSWDLGSGSRIPSWLETQKKRLSILDLSCTEIYGDIPSWLWRMNFLNLSHNQLNSKIPVISDPVDDYGSSNQFFYLSFNRFSGPLPRLKKNATDLDLSNNSFSGDLSEFLCNTAPNALQYLNLGGNNLSGELPAECFVKWKSLKVLNLCNNNLYGRIPDSIGYLTRLESLNLYNNNFYGHVPSSLQNCVQLVNINVADNNLGGDIPKWIDARFYQLRILILRSNNFIGEITASMCQQSSLQILDLSHNRLSGRIPSCLNNLTAMTRRIILDRVYSVHYSKYSTIFQESASISTKGKELSYSTTLFMVTNLDLSVNNLSGEIPREITSLVELRSLDLSRNRLTGWIPDKIGFMKQLESLDLSMNSLSGKVPGSMSDMNFLNYMNLSFNHLTGRIPESTQIGSFNESSFIGNNLCGLPLKISCENDGSFVEKQGQEGDKAEEIDWFYVFLSLGYAVGLSAVLTTLFLKKKWRGAYYAFFHQVWESVYVYLIIRWRRLMRVLGQNS
ncbi:receptor-like protein [Striga asiatica]|uniref:Receptor-like protein n=1 Tax=Striga asiatica TaxID=4170 RepID=A0A5A7RAV9_STRAF|nr:receptor-like protein [Striga asiatica]